MEWKLERRDETIYIDGIAIVSAGGWEDADSLVSRVNSWLASYEKDITKQADELAAANNRVSELQAENARLKACVEHALITIGQDNHEYAVNQTRELLSDLLSDISESSTSTTSTPPEPEARYVIHDLVAYKAPHGYETGVITDLVSQNGKTVYYIREASALYIKEEWIIKKLGESRIDPKYIASWLKPDANNSDS